MAGRLPDLNAAMAREEYRRLLPARVIGFVERSARLLGIGIEGDPGGCFSLRPDRPGALDPLLPALDALDPSDRNRLSARPVPDGERGVWLHPGEPVFDALSRAVRDRFRADGARGAIFFDARAKEEFLFHLGLVSVEEPAPDSPALFPERGAGEPKVLERRLVGLRQPEDGTLVEEPMERFALFHGAPDTSPGALRLAGRSLALRGEAARHASEIASRLAAKHREARAAGIPQRRRELAAGFAYRQSSLARRRAELRQREATAEERQAVRREQDALATEREGAVGELAGAPLRIEPGPAALLVHALVIPPPEGTEIQPHEEPVEQIAVRLAAERERTRGGEVEEVSKPARARAAGLSDWPGFDLLSRRPDGELRHIEVEGRTGNGGVRFEENEWTQAWRLRDRYWLHVVFGCGTPTPTLLRIRDPAPRLLASHRTSGAFSTPAGAIREAAEPA